MRILHITSKMDPKTGGVCQAIRATVRALNKMDSTNEVVSFDEAGSGFLKNDPFLVYTLGKGRGSWSYNPRLVPWLVGNLPLFDAVVLHGLWQYNGFALEKAVSLLKKDRRLQDSPKIFIMSHGMLDPYFQKASGRKIKSIRNWIYWKLIERKVVNNADGLLFTCNRERQLARIPFIPYHPKKEVVVGLGVEEPPLFSLIMHTKFAERCPGINNQCYLLFLGRIHEKKGVDLLVESYSKLAERRIALRQEIPKLVIAGPGLETSFGQTVQRAVKAKNLQDYIFFPGMLTGEAKWGAFYGCEAFILASHQENFGIAVVEALGCGKPVLISDQVNIWPEIEAWGGGIVSEDNLAGAANLLEKWFDLSPEEKATMGENARKCFEVEYDMVTNAKNFLEAMRL